LARAGPDVFYRVELWRIGRRGEQGDGVRDLQLSSSLMPSGSVAGQHGIARRDLGADFLEMFVHGLGAGVGRDHGGAHAAVGAEGAEDLGGDAPDVARHRRTEADRGPDVGAAAVPARASSLGSSPRAGLEPDFHRARGGRPTERRVDQGGEVFLKAAPASGLSWGDAGAGVGASGRVRAATHRMPKSDPAARRPRRRRPSA